MQTHIQTLDHLTRCQAALEATHAQLAAEHLLLQTAHSEAQTAKASLQTTTAALETCDAAAQAKDAQFSTLILAFESTREELEDLKRLHQQQVDGDLKV